MIGSYISKIAAITKRDDAREEFYYPAPAQFLEDYSETKRKKKVQVTVLFDIRWIYYTPIMVDWGRPKIMRHMLQPNIALIAPKQFKEEAGALVTDHIAGHKTVSAFDINRNCQ